MTDASKNLCVRGCRLAATLVAALGALVSAGCAGAHLYDAERHEMAKAAVESFEEADIDAVVGKQRDAHDAILKRELHIVRQQVFAERDAVLRQIIGADDKESSWQFLQEEIDARIAALAGGSAAARRILSERKQVKRREENVGFALQAYRALGRMRNDPKVGPDLARKAQLTADAFQEPKRDDKFEAYKEYRQKYLELEEARRRLDALVVSDGELKRLASEVDEARRRRADVDSRISAAKQEYADAVAAYEAAKAAGTADLPDKLEEVKKKLEKLNKLFDKADGAASAADNFGPLKGLELGSRIEALESVYGQLSRVLEAIAGEEVQPGGPGGPRMEKALTVLSTLSSLTTELGEGLAVPQVSALLLEKEHLRLELESLRTRKRRADRWIALLEQRLDARFIELKRLFKADDVLGDVSSAAKKMSLAAAFGDKSTSEEDRELIAASLIQFANAYTLGSLPEREAKYRLLALRHTMALDAVETSLAQWSNLIAVPLSRLAAYYAAGIRSEEIGQFLGVLGIWATAVRVD